jgi:hypothetical protein
MFVCACIRACREGDARDNSRREEHNTRASTLVSTQSHLIQSPPCGSACLLLMYTYKLIPLNLPCDVYMPCPRVHIDLHRTKQKGAETHAHTHIHTCMRVYICKDAFPYILQSSWHACPRDTHTCSYRRLSEREQRRDAEKMARSQGKDAWWVSPGARDKKAGAGKGAHVDAQDASMSGQVFEFGGHARPGVARPGVDGVIGGTGEESLASSLTPTSPPPAPNNSCPPPPPPPPPPLASLQELRAPIQTGGVHVLQQPRIVLQSGGVYESGGSGSEDNSEQSSEGEGEDRGCVPSFSESNSGKDSDQSSCSDEPVRGLRDWDVSGMQCDLDEDGDMVSGFKIKKHVCLSYLCTCVRVYPHTRAYM